MVGWKNAIPETCLFPMDGPPVGDVNKIAHEKEKEAKEKRGKPTKPLPRPAHAAIGAASQPLPRPHLEAPAPPAKIASRDPSFGRCRHLSQGAVDLLKRKTPPSIKDLLSPLPTQRF